MRQTILSLTLLIVTGLYAQTHSNYWPLEDIVAGSYKAKTLPTMYPLPDGEHYSILSEDGTKIYQYAYKTGKQVAVLFDLKTIPNHSLQKIEGYLTNSTGYRILVWNQTEKIYRRSWKAEVYDYDLRRNMLKPLSDQVGKIMNPTFSPDGRMCAYVRDNNIWLKKFDYDTESAVTTDGKYNYILNGLSDWVYEEEFAVSNRMAWSPDSKILAFVKTDEEEVDSFSFQTYTNQLYPTTTSYKYPKAGTANAKLSVQAYNIDTKDTKQMQLPIDPDAYIPRIEFTSQSDQLAVMTLNRQQNVFSMYYANPKSTLSKLILRDESDSYINPDCIQNLQFANNQFVYVSESSGFAHIYVYSSTGILKRQVTKGNWDVTDLLGIDDKDCVYYVSAEESPLRRSVYSVDSKGKKTHLSTQAGYNIASFSQGMQYFVLEHSSATQVPSYTVHSNTGKLLYVLEDNKTTQQAFSSLSFLEKKFFTIDTPEGYSLHAWILKPKDFSTQKRYPVVMVPYGGPNSQTVLDKYSLGWEYFLAAKGFLVVAVDGRGTGARGEAFRKCTYLKLGVLESDDQITAAKYLAQQSYVDASQISIWGWSFGGTLSILSMSRGEGIFKTAIAIAPVTDWRYYDTVYTERYMRTPGQNEAGYKQTSAFSYINSLQGNLVLIHGTADDNVHFQNTLLYTDALVKADKPYNMQVYTDKSHSLLGYQNRLHLFKSCYRFLLDK